MKLFDYIVIGAGSSGCVLAARLSENPGNKVLLLEAGSDLRASEVPAHMRSANHMNIWNNSAFTWPDLLGRLTGHSELSPVPTGRGIGGTSVINGQIAIRGIPEDYDAWSGMGCTGWSYHDVLPFFCKLENDLDFSNQPWHGGDGPIPVRRAPRSQWGSIDSALADAALSLGYPWSEDHNAPGSTGVSPFAINNRGGDRVSCIEGYLEPARGRPNLEIKSNMLVDRVIFEGKTAIGVRVGTEELFAKKIILSAGTFHSPALLMRSGIGPRSILEPLGIRVLSELPVGSNLLEHPFIPALIHLKSEARARNRDERITNCCVRYTSSGFGSGSEDMMLFSWNQFTGEHALELGFIGVSVMQAFSQGDVSIVSPDPAVNPKIDFRMFSDSRDFERIVDGLHRLHEITRQKPVRAIADRVDLGATGITLEDALSSKNHAELIHQAAFSYAHAAGTCRMGPAHDPNAVVNSECIVNGLENLYVVDCSVMPHNVRANTHFTAMMIAEKIASNFGGLL